MGVVNAQIRYTVDEYLQLERAAEDRHTFLDGEIFAMAGETGEHGDITMNLARAFGNQLEESPCRPRGPNTKIRSGPILMGGQSKKGMFSYPDLVVICGEPEHHDEHKDVIVNPKVIVEVLSPSTEAFDRGKKFERYSNYNPTFTDYLLVSQDEPQVQHFVRQTDGSWLLRTYVGLQTTLTLDSIGCNLELAKVYHRIKFPDLDEPPGEPGT